MSIAINMTGNITKDATIKTVNTKNGSKKCCEVDIACNTGFGDSKSTTYYRFTLWDKRAESVAPFMKKGTKLFVTASDLVIKPYTSKDGKVGTDNVLTVSDFEFISKSDEKSEKPKAAAEKPQAMKATQAIDNDDSEDCPPW